MQQESDKAVTIALLEYFLYRDRRFRGANWTRLTQEAEAKGVELETLLDDPSQVKDLIGGGDITVTAFEDCVQHARITQQNLERYGTRYLIRSDPQYPQSLVRNMGSRSPSILFVRGNLELLKKPAVAVCGGRNISERGRAITETILTQLVSEGATVIAGFASGTAMDAHNAAIHHGGSTILVPADCLRNPGNYGIWNEFTGENHLFISLFPPRSVRQQNNARYRNRVMAALAGSLIVPECLAPSLASSAGQDALSMNLPVFVLDYAQPPETATGNRFLISQGATPIRGKHGVPGLRRIREAAGLPPREEGEEAPVEEAAPEAPAQEVSPQE